MQAIASARLVFSWGFWVRVPLASARQETMILPAPSTLLGTFSAGLARALEGLCGISVGEVVSSQAGHVVLIPKLLVEGRVVREVYFRVLRGYGIRVMDLTRHLQAPYIREDNLSDIGQWRAVREVGKIYAPGMEAEAAFLIDLDALSKTIFARLCGSIEIVDPVRLLVASLTSISRVGPVEGIVSPTSVNVIEVNVPEAVEEPPNTPCPYFSLNRGSGMVTGAVIVMFWDWRDPSFWIYGPRNPIRRVAYVVPLEARLYSEGVLAPFKPCNLLKGVQRGFLTKIGGEESFYPYTAS